MIRWTPTSLKHLKAIHAWIAADDPEAARYQCRRIVEALQQIDKFPSMGRVRTSVKERQLSVPGTPYIIFYGVDRNAVLVRAIWHGSRLKPKRFR